MSLFFCDLAISLHHAHWFSLFSKITNFILKFNGEFFFIRLKFVDVGTGQVGHGS